jgi:hypothetical protein
MTAGAFGPVENGVGYVLPIGSGDQPVGSVRDSFNSVTAADPRYSR